MITLDETQVQGLLKRGYGDLPHAAALLGSFESADAARAWLREVRALVTPAAQKSKAPLHLGLTYSGLRRLAGDVLDGFPLEFVDGPATARASLVLGDDGPSAPEGWLWGGPNTPRVDAIVLLYGDDPALHDARVAEETARLEAEGNRCLVRIDSPRQGEYDHFGFRDGISQPVIDGFAGKAPTGGRSQPGEFVLGYPNEYGGTDAVALGADADFGRNGSYLVVRQLAQDAGGFWRDVRDVAAPVGLDPFDLAARVVGRERDGRPLTLPAGVDYAPGSDVPIPFRDAPYGACPLGAHVRRANPRDAIPGIDKADDSLKIARNHRLLRRGRRFGETMTPETALNAPAAFDRGLLFMALNASIRRQFEFVQQTWLNDPKFGGLYEDVDVLAGGAEGERTFTLPTDPVSRRLLFPNRYVRVLGSGYFFLPSLDALERLTA